MAADERGSHSGIALLISAPTSAALRLCGVGTLRPLSISRASTYLRYSLPCDLDCYFLVILMDVFSKCLEHVVLSPAIASEADILTLADDWVGDAHLYLGESDRIHRANQEIGKTLEILRDLIRKSSRIPAADKLYSRIRGCHQSRWDHDISGKFRLCSPGRSTCSPGYILLDRMACFPIIFNIGKYTPISQA